jgi:hypothetical protein
MSELRSKDKLWLVDELATNEFPRNLLPITGEVLRVLEWHAKRNPRDLNKAIRETTLKIKEQWKNANVPTIDRCHILKKVRKLHDEYAALKKSKSRESGKAVEHRMSFQVKLKNLFDIAHQDAMQLMTIKEDCDFLKAQRGHRREGKMLGVDKDWVGKEERKRKRKMIETKRLKLEKEAYKDRITTVQYESSSSSSSPLDQSPCTSPVKKSCRGRKAVVITSEVAAALDRSQISSRGAMSVLVPFASALGSNVEELSVSASTIHRHRSKHREEKAAEIKESFSPTVPLTVHWDGKLMPGLTNGEVVDRLPILVSGEGVLKLLAAPVTDGKAEPTATTIMEVINEWNLQDRIAALCFDTTATNSGSKGGVCLRLQQILGRDLLHLACRHHILELLLGAVFSALVPEVSRSPDITIFQQFKEFWPSVVTTDYRTAEDAIRRKPWATDVLNFCQDQLHLNHPRDDYRELLELVVIFLGGVPHGRQSIVFRKPGAVHRARWMARAIYGLKMWIFLSQFSQHRLQRPSTSRVARSGVLEKLSDFCIFLAKHYVRAWFSARSAVSAPRHDIAIFKALEEEDNAIIRKAGTKTLARHLWYLSEVNVGMALFDEELSLQEKESFVANMKAVDGSEDPSPRLSALPDGMNDMTVASFATKNTKRFFELLDIDTSFFDEDPANWKDSPSYQAGLKRVEGLVVTNDAAERGVALVQEFTRSGRTKAEDQLQFLLQVVEAHRQEFPHRTKSQLIKKMK